MNQRRSRQHYTPEQKAAFFALFDELQNNTAAARQLGMNPAGTYNWLRERGLRSRGKTGSGPHPGKEHYLRLRKAGHSRRDAATVAGVHYRTAGDWDRGTRRTGPGRVFADGRFVNYVTGMTTYTDQTADANPLRMEHLAQPLHPRLVSLEERERIGDLHRAGHSIRQIAGALGRAPSTISRELRRNRSSTGHYPYAAHRKAAKRRPRPKPRKLVACGRLRGYVQEKLAARWSPEQISRSLEVEFPTDLEMRVTPETIYQTLYLQGRGICAEGDRVRAAGREGQARPTPAGTTSAA